jgi:hypothetical protein
MTTTSPHAADQEVFPAAAALADALREQGHLSDPRWLAAVAAVPRHLFVPAQAWAQPAGEQAHAIDSAADPAEWMRQVYSPGTAVITQLDDGQAPVASGEGVPTSSLSDPAIVADFLELLAVRDGNTPDTGHDIHCAAKSLELRPAGCRFVERLLNLVGRERRLCT